MKAAQITSWNETPKYVDIPAPSSPGPDEVQIKVLAAGIHRLVRGRITGKHFSATKLPHIPGSDGVGLIVPGNKLVFFSTFWEKGSLAELVNVNKQDVTPIDVEDADPLRIAGLINPAFSSWMSLKVRVFDLPKNFSVLVVGATSTAGSIALALSRHLGAGKVIGAARNAEAMKAMGYDDTIILKEPAEQTDFSKAENVDVILDYVYGPATLQLLKSLKPTTPTQYVQIGTLSQATIDLPGDLLRSKDITLRGSAPGAYTGRQMAEQLPDIIQAVAKMDNQKFKFIELKDIESEWPDMKSRLIVKVNELAV